MTGMIANIIVLLILGVVVALAIRSLRKSHKGGGCSCGCSSCGCGCDSQPEKKPQSPEGK